MSVLLVVAGDAPSSGLISLGPAAVVPAGSSGGVWVPRFAEEFDGDGLEPSRWENGFGWGLSSNNTFGYCDPDHNRVVDGVLVQHIERRAQGGKPFSVGCINTKDRFSQLYGYWEVRLRAAPCPGARAAFWGKPADESWPPELDVIEVHGDERHVARLSAHWREGRRIVRSRGGWAGPDLSAGWHTFGAEWSPTEVVWYVDGVARRRLQRGATYLDDGGAFYVILNAQVYLASSTCGEAGSTQLVDHVRVWSRP
ncbi:MAG: glycoside hydrolase family 16 protein [Acidimicrobiia bacterium]